MKGAGGTRSKSFPWSWVFLLAAVALFAVVWVSDHEAGNAAWASFLALSKRIVPVLAVVYAVIFVFNLFGDPGWITRHVGAKSGLRGWSVAIIAGILSLGPVYPWYVLLGELKAKGMRPSLAAAFLYARAVKPPLIPIMIHYFGAVFTLTLMFFIAVFAVLNGALMGRIMSVHKNGAP